MTLACEKTTPPLGMQLIGALLLSKAVNSKVQQMKTTIVTSNKFSEQYKTDKKCMEIIFSQI
jgi:hypothetical protein